jgi:hypothetical protein
VGVPSVSPAVWVFEGFAGCLLADITPPDAPRLGLELIDLCYQIDEFLVPALIADFAPSFVYELLIITEVRMPIIVGECLLINTLTTLRLARRKAVNGQYQSRWRIYVRIRVKAGPPIVKVKILFQLDSE